MDKFKSFKKIICYTSLITPLLILGLEITTKGILSIVGNERFNFLNISPISKSFDKKISFDAITGWRPSCDQAFSINELPDDIICNRHGLIKTPFSPQTTQPNSFGVLLLGNSVAMGEGLYSRDNLNTFASQLELNLREKNDNIDLINAAYSGFNSWQEHAETIRYLNSSVLYQDLPELNLIVSFGGIQDFWSFLKLLVNQNYISNPDLHYRYANGLMINTSTISYFDKLKSIYDGNIINAIHGLSSSIIQNSNTIKLVNGLLRIYFSNNVFPLDKSLLSIELSERKVFDKLESIAINRFSLDYEEYLRIRDYFISSVVRNISANSVLLDNGNYFYVYAPTYFSTLEIENTSRTQNYLVSGIGHLINSRNFKFEIFEKELKLIEEDYKEALLTKLNDIKSVNLLDYSSKAEGTYWFLDYSHFNQFAASKLSEMLAQDLAKSIERND